MTRLRLLLVHLLSHCRRLRRRMEEVFSFGAGTSAVAVGYLKAELPPIIAALSRFVPQFAHICVCWVFRVIRPRHRQPR